MALFTIGASLASVPAQQRCEPQGTVRLRILDPNGAPVPSAVVGCVRKGREVAFVRSHGEWTLSLRDFDGEAFRLEGLPAGRTMLVVQSPPLAPVVSAAFDVEDGAVTDVVVRMTAGCRLSATVRDSRGEVIQGAVVRTCSPQECDDSFYTSFAPEIPAHITRTMVLTDRAGRFCIAGMAPGRYAITVTHPDHAGARIPFEVAAQRTLTLGPVVLRDGAIFEGTVMLDGKPLADASVHANRPYNDEEGVVRNELLCMRTDAAGRFRSPRALTAGDWSVTAGRPAASDPFVTLIDLHDTRRSLRVENGRQLGQVVFQLSSDQDGVQASK